MTTPSRTLAVLTTFLAALALSLLGGAGAAMAIPIPIPIALAPQMNLIMSHALIEPNGAQGYTLQAHYVTGTALAGTIRLSRDLHNGAPAQQIFSTTNLAVFTGAGSGAPIVSAPVGDETWTAVFTPSTAGARSATSSVSFQVRFAGATATVKTGSAIAGAATLVTTTIAVPRPGIGQPIDGRVSLQVDALGEQASCLPTALNLNAASCSTTLPSSLAAGTHSLTVSWTGSPSFQSASTTVPLVIASAEKSSASATPTPQTPAPSPTAVALAGGTDSNSLPQVTTTTAVDTTGFPLWIGIAVAILLIALLGVGVLVTVGMVRSRRANAAA